MVVDIRPGELADEIATVIASRTPSMGELEAASRQLLDMGCAASSETVVESVYRCTLTDHLQQRFRLAAEDLPASVHSSHIGPARVCVAMPPHAHHTISHRTWRKAWPDFRKAHREVDIRDPQAGMSLRRADLFLVAGQQIVSVEFKYAGPTGIRDAEACALQIRRHAANHATALLIIYCGGITGTEVPGLSRLRDLLGPDVPVVVVHGPAVLPARKPNGVHV